MNPTTRPAAQMRNYAGTPARHMRPTQKHRIALSAGILGTVYATNAAGETRYFDFDYAAAREFAGIDANSDPRIWRESEPWGGRRASTRMALWIVRN